LEFFKSAEEILVDSAYYDVVVAGCHHHFCWWISSCTLHLFFFLMTVKKQKAFLGISAWYHDSAAALIVDGKVVAAAQEERFTRVKFDPAFPRHAVEYVLKEGGLSLQDIDAVVFYEKPLLKFDRLLETFHAFAPYGLPFFLAAIPVWVKEKLFMKRMLRRELGFFDKNVPRFLFPEHHHSHAASAFYPSPFHKAAILTIDGVGEWATTTIGVGEGSRIRVFRELGYPHSLGLLYSAFTYFLGFRVNSGEYKLMGLAPYGDPDSPQTKLFAQIIREMLVDIRNDGSILLNMKYFAFATRLKMVEAARWETLFGVSLRKPESEIRQEHMNLALAIQWVTEEIILKLAATAKTITGCENLVMAGGVALNSVANGKLLQSGLFKDIWIQPAAGDAGGALGAAYIGWHTWLGEERTHIPQPDAMQGAFMGPAYTDGEIMNLARRYGAPFRQYDDFGEMAKATAATIAGGKVVGWFQGRMEYGPRALGNRSILADPRNPEMQKTLNLKIKYREGFRPFAPAVLEEDTHLHFDMQEPSPYMLHVVPVQPHLLINQTKPETSGDVYARLYADRSVLPAITHVDHSARIQTVSRHTNERFWMLLSEFKKLTGFGVLINTSFNVRGEPIVCSPEDAFRCFLHTEMDILIMGNVWFDKREMTDVVMHDIPSQSFGSD
jgi:carbamoyltransferase